MKGSIDLILLLDVLEHLKEPWKVLEYCRSLLSNSGVVIASIPNVRSIKVLSPLVFRGKWDYQDAGILDRTHLRFFTRESAIKLFTNNGYQVETVIGNGPLRPNHIKTLAGALVFNFNIITLGFFAEFLANQYLILAKPSNLAN